MPLGGAVQVSSFLTTTGAAVLLTEAQAGLAFVASVEASEPVNPRATAMDRVSVVFCILMSAKLVFAPVVRPIP